MENPLFRAFLASGILTVPGLAPSVSWGRIVGVRIETRAVVEVVPSVATVAQSARCIPGPALVCHSDAIADGVEDKPLCALGANTVLPGPAADVGSCGLVGEETNSALEVVALVAGGTETALLAVGAAEVRDLNA